MAAHPWSSNGTNQLRRIKLKPKLQPMEDGAVWTVHRIAARALDGHCAQRRNGPNGEIEFPGRRGHELCLALARYLELNQGLTEGRQGLVDHPQIILRFEVSRLYPHRNSRVS